MELVDTWRWAASLPGARPTPLLLLRIAEALAESAPHEAVQVAWRAVEAEPPEPVRSRALRRYADLLDASGESERATQVRRHLASPPS